MKTEKEIKERLQRFKDLNNTTLVFLIDEKTLKAVIYELEWVLK